MNNEDWLLALITGVFMLAFTIAALYSICSTSDPISSCELEETTCWQMRKQGWTEKEIEQFMDSHGGQFTKELTQGLQNETQSKTNDI